MTIEPRADGHPRKISAMGRVKPRFYGYWLGSGQWRSPSWAGVGHGPPGKIKKSTTVGLFCEILYNFVSVLGFD